MKAFAHWGVPLIAAAWLFFTSGCTPTDFTVGGNVKGLAGSLNLSLNDGETLSITKNGIYKFTSRLPANAAYQVTVPNQPAGQICTISNGSGVVGSANVSNVTVTCSTLTQFHIGGSVSGLGGQLKLQLNGSDTIELNTDGPFQFSNLITIGQPYSVIVSAQPVNQNCSVSNGSGATGHADINNVAISCNDLTYHVGGSISGLLGELTIALSGAESLSLSDDGNYQFPSALPNGTSYDVTVDTQPAGQRCSVVHGSGAINSTDAAVNINCVTTAPVISSIWPEVAQANREMKISGSNLDLSTVAYDGATVTPTLQTPNEIRFVVPENSRDNYALALENSEGLTNRAVTQGELVTGATQVSSNYFHTCALMGTGVVQCWGLNNSGQLGDGTTTSGTAAVKVSGISNAISIATGAYHSCAVLSTGTVQCWGVTFSPSTGGPRIQSNIPVAVSGINNAVTVSAGFIHSCALLSTGAVQCWGSNYFGQLGNSSTSDSQTPVPISEINNAVAIAVGGIHNCALLNTGAVKCWGSNGSGQLGIGTYTNSEKTPVTVSGINNAVAVAASNNHSCALLSTGAVKCWGSNSSGQLGDGTNTGATTPVTVNGIGNATSITARGDHTCALLSTGAMLCWGENNYGQLGSGSNINSATPVMVNGISNVISVTAGFYHSCGVLSTGAVQCWGRTIEGQLGNGTTIQGSPPATISSVTNAVSAATHGDHSCALLSTGEVSCWGYNRYGQLGNGSLNSSTTAVTVSNISNAVSITTSSTNSCAVLGTGAVKCWGHNYFGQLGDGSTNDSSTPVTVNGISNAVSVAAGGDQSCALLSTGIVQCWGYNNVGQLGNGSQTNSLAPVTVSGLTNAVSIAASNGHVCAVLSTGSMKCWGYNTSGQLGNGLTSNSTTPVAVNGINSAVSVAVGSAHTCAVLSTGSVRCWGSNFFGQLGNGTSTDSAIPVTVNGISGAVSVASGVSQNCALLTSGTVRCWGSYMKEGNVLNSGITIADAALPVVSSISNAVSIVTGDSHSCAVLSTGAMQCWGENFYGQIGVPANQFGPDIPVVRQ